MQPINSIANHLAVMLTICPYASAWTPLSLADHKHTGTPKTIKLTHTGNPANPTAATSSDGARKHTAASLMTNFLSLMYSPGETISPARISPACFRAPLNPPVYEASLIAHLALRAAKENVPIKLNRNVIVKM